MDSRGYSGDGRSVQQLVRTTRQQQQAEVIIEDEVEADAEVESELLRRTRIERKRITSSPSRLYS